MFVEQLTPKDIDEIFKHLGNNAYLIGTPQKNTAGLITLMVRVMNKETKEASLAILADYTCYINNTNEIDNYCNFMYRRFGIPYLENAQSDVKRILRDYNIKTGKQTTLTGYTEGCPKQKQKANVSTVTDKTVTESITNIIKSRHPISQTKTGSEQIKSTGKISTENIF